MFPSIMPSRPWLGLVPKYLRLIRYSLVTILSLVMSTHNTFLRRNEKYSSTSICKCTLSRVMMNTEVRQKINTRALLLKFHFFFTFFHSDLFSAFLSTKYFCHFLCMSVENDCCHDNKCKWGTDRTVTLKKIEN